MFALLALVSPFTFPAMAARYKDAVADVSASSTIAATPEQIFTYLLDFKNLQASMPCIGKWEMSQRTFGEGASAMVRYDIGAMHRKLPMSLSRADAPYRIDLEHLGNLGFTTVIRLKSQPSDDGRASTLVSILTPLNAPPWPFRPYYYGAVQVEWNQCYAATLNNIATALAAPAVQAPASSRSAPVAPADPLYSEPVADPTLLDDVSPS